MLVTSFNRETLILTNIRQTLEQIKDADTENKPLVINHALTACDDLPELTDEQLATLTLAELAEMSGSIAGSKCTVDFYLDAAKTNLAFSDSTDTDPYMAQGAFSTDGQKTFYLPSDSELNDSTSISDYLAQPIYYVTATFCDGHVENLVYRNIDNLLFQSVIVASKKNPQYSTNDNTCIIVPQPQTVDNYASNDDSAFVTVTFDLCLQLIVFDWAKLSEESRESARVRTSNLVRNALMADRYRSNNATMKNKDLNGTFIGQLALSPSADVLKGVMRVQCVFNATSQTY